MVTLDDGTLGAAATELARQWESFGVTVDLQIFSLADSQIFARDYLNTREYDVLIYNIAMGADPDMQPYYHSSQVGGAGLNFSNYVNHTVDSLLTAASGTLNPEARAAYYNDFLREWANDVPALGLYRNSLFYLMNGSTRAFSENTTLVTRWNRFNEVPYFAVNQELRLRTP
jgi:ABC-type transport system substrate-binding protein